MAAHALVRWRLRASEEVGSPAMMTTSCFVVRSSTACTQVAGGGVALVVADDDQADLAGYALVLGPHLSVFGGAGRRLPSGPHMEVPRRPPGI
ncbi:hypothetical protein AMK29_31390 [Streptomyces sp. CB02261]|nr:hypothetical protein AMK29_31390 [Streptomyces sp. CB02261]